MRRSTIRSLTAAMVLVPLVSTCTAPEGMVASAHQQAPATSEDGLIDFLIEGEQPSPLRSG
jgi:hypothetical protein